jgi:hypothetical protein
MEKMSRVVAGRGVYAPRCGRAVIGRDGPIFANFYLDRSDRFVEHTLVPAYTRGEQRKRNNAYRRLMTTLSRARRAGNREVLVSGPRARLRSAEGSSVIFLDA